MSQQKVISREYKLVLKTANFTGNKNALKDKAGIFWESLKKAIQQLSGNTTGDLNNFDKNRTIMFYDTNDPVLKKSNYIFRERTDSKTNIREVTLKFRHPDRYVSQDRDMMSKNKASVKFEEDIKAPFMPLYSFSCSQDIPGKKELSKLKDIIRLYPDLSDQLNNYEEEEKIFPVHDQPVYEIVITGPLMDLCEDHSAQAECALILWYEKKAFESDPIIVEFSFRYGSKKEKYCKEAAQKSHDLFLLMQKDMKEWIDNENATKTGFIFNDK